MLTFKAYLPRYFYDYGAGRHPFTIYVLFLAEDQIIKMVSYREFIIDYYPGMERDSEEEALRAIQIERAYGWRVRPLEYAFDDERNRQRGWSDDY